MVGEQGGAQGGTVAWLEGVDRGRACAPLLLSAGGCNKAWTVASQLSACRSLGQGLSPGQDPAPRPAGMPAGAPVGQASSVSIASRRFRSTPARRSTHPCPPTAFAPPPLQIDVRSADTYKLFVDLVPGVQGVRLGQGRRRQRRFLHGRGHARNERARRRQVPPRAGRGRGDDLLRLGQRRLLTQVRR